jgi:propane monooxygenase coupling protein
MPSDSAAFTLLPSKSSKPNVTVTPLPSMIRVDAVGRMDVNYDEVSEALGEEPCFFDAAEFEENLSRHYGRVNHTDEATITSANPEDAADYLGFDLTPTSA